MPEYQIKIDAMLIIRLDQPTIPPPVLQIITPSLPSGNVGTFYSQALQASGGTAPYTWSVFSGALPGGLSLASDTIQGTPTASGTFNFNIKLQDSVGQELFRDYQIGVASTAGNDYFNELIALSEHFFSRSLRDAAQLSAIVPSGQNGWSYSPGTDNYHSPQDASKLILVPNAINQGMNNQGELMFPSTSSQWGVSDLGCSATSVIIIWDWWWGPEIRQNFGNITNWKAYQVRTGNDGAWWTNMENPGPAAVSIDPNLVAYLTDEFRSGGRPEGMTRNERVLPSGTNTYVQFPNYDTALPMYHSRWTRYIIEIKPCQPPASFTDWNNTYGVTVTANPGDVPDGRWHMVSKWTYTEGQSSPKRELYKVPMNWNAPTKLPHIAQFLVEQNSSKNGALGNWTAYMRNLVILKNYNSPDLEADPIIMRAPVA